MSVVQALHDFATWAPLLRLILKEHPDLREWTGGVGVEISSLPSPAGDPGAGPARREPVTYPEADVRNGLPFDVLARAAVITGADSAVQGLVASPGWILIGDHGGGSGDLVAVDLSPGPAGHIGQVVVLSHESEIGAWLLADSLTDLVLGHENSPEWHDLGREPPAVVMVNSAEGWTVQAAATDQLEVLTIGNWDETPSDLTPLVGLPRLRTLVALPGKVADPLVIGRLTRLEYLEIGLAEWRALLDADPVPRSLLAAGIPGFGHDPAEVDEVYDALIRLWGGTGLQTVTIEGDLR